MPAGEHACYRLCLLHVRKKVNKNNEQNLPLQPSGSRGLIIGDIFGLNAGLTRFELTLFRFFGLRANFGSFLLLVMENAGLVGAEAESSNGLGLLAPGVLNGPNFGVFRADIRGVVESPSTIPVWILESTGRSREASGSVKSSSKGCTSKSPLKVGEGCMRIREAGVAGVAGVEL